MNVRVKRILKGENKMKGNKFFMNQIEKESLLSVEKELVKKAWVGNKDARNKLVTSNLRFVVKIAGNYRGQGLDFEDLVSEGIEGLIIAATKFNPSKDNKFITYAVWWIRQSIQKALYETGRNVKLPQNRKDEFLSSKWKMASLDAVYGEDEDADTLGNFISDSRIKNSEEMYIQKEISLALKKDFCPLHKRNRR